MNLLEQVALRMAATDLLQPRQGLAERLHRLGITALCVGQQAVRRRNRNLLPDRVSRVLARAGLRAASLDMVQQDLRLRPAGPRQALQVLQVQERQHLVIQPLRDVVGHVLPAFADVDTGQFQPSQQ